MAELLQQARRGHVGLYGLGVAMAALAPVLAVLAVVDSRTLLGAPLWFKPLKFAISIAAYSATLAWMLGQLPRPALRRTGWVLVVSLVVEMVIIVGQAARGQLSHFNHSTALGDALFSVMGLSIGVLYVGTVVVAVRFLREPGGNLAYALAVRLGLLVTLLGMSVGFVMVALDSHAVGVPDGGPGLALVGWSTIGGDLRIAHFLGLHSLQALPLLAAGLALLAARWSPAGRLDGPARSQIVTVTAVGYALVVVLLTVQALRSQPLLQPDPLTLAGWLTILAGGSLALAAVLRAATVRSRSAEPAAPLAVG